jgi:hypothetical protein
MSFLIQLLQLRGLCRIEKYGNLMTNNKQVEIAEYLKNHPRIRLEKLKIFIII